MLELFNKRLTIFVLMVTEIVPHTFESKEKSPIFLCFAKAINQMNWKKKKKYYEWLFMFTAK